MCANIVKSTEVVVSCSDNGQHPLVYITLKSGSGQCQYCGQKFERADPPELTEKKTAA